MEDDSSKAFCENDPKFYHERELLIEGKVDPLHAKFWVELHAGGLVTPIRAFAIELAKTIDINFYDQYYALLLDHV